jgi:hypothetical protein
MTIDEAIEGLKTRLTPKGVIQFGEPDNDIKLGIEALKAWKFLREHSGMSYDALLPGETEEVQKAHGLPLGGITIKLPGETEE